MRLLLHFWPIQKCYSSLLCSVSATAVCCVLTVLQQFVVFCQCYSSLLCSVSATVVCCVLSVLQQFVVFCQCYSSLLCSDSAGSRGSRDGTDSRVSSGGSRRSSAGQTRTGGFYPLPTPCTPHFLSLLLYLSPFLSL